MLLGSIESNLAGVSIGNLTISHPDDSFNKTLDGLLVATQAFNLLHDSVTIGDGTGAATSLRIQVDLLLEGSSKLLQLGSNNFGFTSESNTILSDSAQLLVNGAFIQVRFYTVE